jgi:hypothetical protein
MRRRSRSVLQEGATPDTTSGSLTVHFSIQSDSNAAAEVQRMLAHTIMDEEFSASLALAGLRLTGFVMQAMAMGEPTPTIPPVADAVAALPGFVDMSTTPICTHCAPPGPPPGPPVPLVDQYDMWWLVSASAGFVIIVGGLCICVMRRRTPRSPRMSWMEEDLARKEAELHSSSEEHHDHGEDLNFDEFHVQPVKKSMCTIQ